MTNRDERTELERVAAPGPATPETGALSLWLSTKGRISRKTLWLKFITPILLIVYMAGFVDGRAGAGYTDPNDPGPASAWAVLLILWPGVVGVIKRLHDHDRSGWVWAAVFPGGLALFLTTFSFQEALGQIVGLTWALVVLIVGIWLGFVRGTEGPNRYGPASVLDGAA